MLDTRDIIDVQVKESLKNIEIIGESKYKESIDERLIKCEIPITDVLPKNKLPLFNYRPAKSISKQKLQVATLKSDCNLFSRLYVSCQTRSGDLDSFFCP